MSFSKALLNDQSLFISKTLIDGQWVDAASGKTFDVHDPASDELIGSCPECDTQDLQAAISSASKAFPKWRALSGRARGRLLRRWFDLVVANKADIANIITWENGKRKSDGEGEVEFSAGFIEWYAEEASRAYGDVVPHSNPESRASVVKQPIGVCGLITPWNFPAGMIARKAAPALAAGCTVVVKTDGLTPYSANALGVLSQRAGIPPGVLNIVTALDNTPKLGLALCESPVVKKISFTGSTRIGKILAQQSASTLKKLSLELGGNAPFIIFGDCDLKVAVAALIASKFKVSGQTCSSANRIYVQEDIHDEFVKLLTTEVRKLSVGPGFDAKNTLGPLVSASRVTKVSEHVQDSIAKGAKLICGGRSLSHLGARFYEPTVLIGATADMRLATEETFGPIAAIFKFSTESEVVAAANDCDVGLAAYVMTQDLIRATRVSESLDTGMVAINTAVISESSAPFGGVKFSGLGREGGKYGMDEFMITKAVIMGNIRSQL